MWKRWSIKSLTGETSVDSSKAKQEITTVHPGPVTNSTIQETVSDPQEKTDKAPSPDEIPAPQISAEDTVEHSTAPVSSTEASADILGSIPLDTPAPPEVVTPPSTIPLIESSNPPSTSLEPSSPVKPGVPSSDTPVNLVHTPTFSNTLSPPGVESPARPIYARRLSFRSLAFFYGRDNQPPSVPKSQAQEHSKPNIQPQVKLSRSQKEALSAAITLRTLMVGPGSFPSLDETSVMRQRKSMLPHFSSAVFPPAPSLKKVKAQLLKSESANAIISYLRRLPLPDGPSFHVSGRASSDSLVTHPDAGGAPIHAVCLACTDEEAEKMHFSRLQTSHSLPPPSLLTPSVPPTASSSSSPNIATASLESLIPVLRDLHLVSLLTSPDLGFGQSVGDDEDIGVFTGSVPSPATLVEGFEEITTQLMNLGFATSKAVAPSHAGIYPPKDRISVLTYWWGLELVLPEPSVQHLGTAKSISSTLLNFLSALALFNNGVREALPFIRYIANFVDFEWSSIKAQDKGQGVVCAATWVMPAAMVPRPWDFPSRPETTPGSKNTPTSPLAPETSAGNGEKATEGTNPTSPLERSGLPGNLYPVAPAMPLMPQLLVTPATLPRKSLPTS